MRAGGRHGPQQALSRASLMAEPPLRCEGLSPEQPECLCPERRAGGRGWPSSPLAAPARSSLCVFRPAWNMEGWEPVRTALLGELVRVMTAEADPAAAELKDFFLLIFLQPA